MVLIHISRILYLNTKEYSFFAHGCLFKTGHILRHKTNLYKFKKIEIILCIIYTYNAIKQI